MIIIGLLALIASTVMIVMSPFKYFYMFGVEVVGIVLLIVGIQRRKAKVAAAQIMAQRQQEEERRRKAAEAARLERERQEEAARKAEEARRAEAARAQAEEEKKPIDPPQAMNGYYLAYFYPDVEFDCTPEQLERARLVPPRKQLTLNRGDGDEIELEFNGAVFGTMKPNRLRDMVNDYDVDGRTIIAASRAFDEKPLFSLAFYRSADELIEKWKLDDSFHKFKLVSNGNDEMQDNISGVGIGCPVEFDLDPDKGKYLVLAEGLEIGYLPASAEKYVDEDPECRIMAIEENENEKYSVTVMMISKR